MSEKKLKLGIIGMGRVSMAHADATKELNKQVKLVAIAELRAERAKEMAEALGVKKVYTDYRELLKNPEIEAVIICLPNYLHHPVCIEAARAGKHILVEKPMCMNLAEADEMISEANKHAITLMVGQSRRFSWRCRRSLIELMKSDSRSESTSLFLYIFINRRPTGGRVQKKQED